MRSKQVDGLRQSREKVFQAPPLEWIEERLGNLQRLLERRTEKSAKLLRRILGPIRLEPQKVDIGRPYYIARMALNALVLMEKPPSGDGPEGGSNTLRWWTRTQRIRTAAEVPLKVVLTVTEERPLYQQVAGKARRLRDLGLSYRAIAQHLGVDDKTIAKALHWLRSMPLE